MRRTQLTLGVVAAILACLLAFPATGLAVGTGAIAGQVEDASSHAPVAGIQACAYKASGFGEFAGCDETDGSGSYSIQGLGGGSYKVQFSPSFSGGANYIGQYYSGKSSWSGADAVTVVEAATTPAIDAALQPGGQIAGTVTDTASNPIGGIEVCARKSEIGLPICAQTEANGEYTISGLTSGSYAVRFSPGFLNYVTQYYDGRKSEAEADRIDVVAGSKEPGIDAEMEEGGELSGTVVDAVSEAPLQGVMVCAYRAGSGEGVFPCAFTDAGGKYTVSGLAKDDYKVKFVGPEGVDPVYASQYYDGKPSFAGADAISVGLGTMTSGIDADLVELGKIAGNVSEAGGPAIGGVSVCASSTTPALFVNRCATSDPSGNYTITGLDAGSYLVRFEGGFDHVTQYYDGKEREGEASPVAVSLAATTAGIDAALDRAGKIEGTVIDATTKAVLEGVEVCAVKPHVSYTAAPTHCATTGAGGKYTVGGLAAGSFRVHFASPTTGPNQNYLDQYFSGRTVPRDADGVAVSLGATTVGIDAEMHSAGRIAGTITSAGSGMPLVGAWVCASRAKGYEVTGGNCAYSDSVGNYTISRLATGSYKVRFMPGLEGASYLSQYFSDRPTRKLADAVPVTAGSTTANVNAALHLGGRIAGTVIDAGSKAPIRGVEACAFAVGAKFPSLCGQTDSDGNYTVEPLKSGSYEVRFAPGYGYHLNYLSQFYDGKAGRDTASPVQVVAGSTAAGIDAELAAAGRIGGAVIDAVTKDPAPSVQACAIDPDDEEAWYCGVTNASGQYTINGVPSGSYKIRFSPGGEFGFGSENVNYNYATQYYDGKASEAEAKSVVVAAGATKPGVDAEMEEGGQVSGRVSEAGTNAPIRYVQVCIYRASDLEFVTCTSSAANGTYRFEGLAGGEYVVGFQAGFAGPGEPSNYLAEYYAGSPFPEDADPVTVAAGALTPNIDAELLPGGQIEGRVTDAAEGAPLAYVGVCALEAAGEEEAFACAETNSDGEYLLSGLPSGAYKVEFFALSDEEGGPVEEFTTQFFPGRPSAALADPVQVTTGAAVGSIDAKMVEPGGADGEEGGGGTPGGGSPPPAAAPAPAPGPPPAATRPGRKPAKQPRCRKGFKKKRIHGRTRCVKTKHHR